ncbi:MAG: G-protein coupled receptor, partial [Gammaproteobacteria bacterium]|nr:G-protein coupled receptor [Gammaproteobacteria bacterium]
MFLLNESVEFCHHNETFPGYQSKIRMFGSFPIIVLGLATNSLNILVFSRQTMRKTVLCWFLLGLSISDQILLIATFGMVILPVFAEFSNSLDFLEFSTVTARWSYPIALTFRLCSVYLTLALGLYRYA